MCDVQAKRDTAAQARQLQVDNDIKTDRRRQGACETENKGATKGEERTTEGRRETKRDPREIQERQRGVCTNKTAREVLRVHRVVVWDV